MASSGVGDEENSTSSQQVAKFIDPYPSFQRRQVVIGGNIDDVEPEKEGVHEIASIIKMLETAGVLCCIVFEPALIYYGARRIMFVGKQKYPIMFSRG
jgi:hypothetical protein